MNGRRYPRPAALPDPLPEHLILDASAGTGKTYALEHIILDLLLPRPEGPPPLQIQQILVSTYTEKAAGEMRERIRTLIGHILGMGFEEAGPGERCWEIDAAARAALERARLHFDRATITTIHAFCQNLLRETAFLTGEPFQSEVVDGKTFFRQTFHDCVRDTWGVPGAPKAAAIRKALADFRSETELCRFLEAVKGCPGRRHPDPRDPGAARDRFRARYDRAGIEALLKDEGLKGQSLAPLCKNLDAVRDAADFEAIAPILGKLLKPEAKGPAALFAHADAPAPDPARAAALALLDLHEALDSPETRAVEDFLAETVARAEAVKARDGLLDFDDMAPRVVRALRSPTTGPALVELLRSRYKVVLLDEFQDTSPDQWAVFQGLFGEQTRLFLIGDPKQAIYGFRGGDVHAYLRAQKDLRDRPGTEQVALSHNHRSTPAMIAAYNRILDQAGQPPFFTGAIDYAIPVRPGKPGLAWVDPARPELPLPPIRLVSVPMEKGPAEPQLVAAARALALEIRTLLGLRPELRNGDQRSALDPADVFVLTRKGDESELMHEALWAAGVPASYYKRDGVFQSREAEDLLSVLQAIEDPADLARRAKAMLTPVFGVPLAELRAAQQLPDAHPFLERLRAWNRLARHGDFGELFRQLFDEGLVRRLIRREQDDQAASVWAQLADHMLEQCSARQGDFAEAVAQLEAWVQGLAKPPGDNATKYRAASDQSAVQILTMHAAKGLEAKVVAIFGGFTGTRPGAIHRFALGQETRHWIGRPAPPRLAPLIQQEDQEEAQRLLYVALTRAQAQLLLPVYVLGPETRAAEPESRAADPRGDYQGLNARLRTLLAEGLDAPANAGLFTLAPLDGAPRPEPPAPAIPLPVPPDPGFWQAVPSPARVASFTSLSRERHLDSRDDPEFKAGPPDRQGVPAGPEIGSCVHAILEQVPLDSAAGAISCEAWQELPGITRILQEVFRASRLGAGDRTRVAGLAFRAFRAAFPLPDGRGTAALQDLAGFARELPFLMRRPGTQDYLDGSIDLLFERAGRSYFLDWKTNALAEYGSAACQAAVQEDYALQFAIYALAACRFLGISDEADYEARFGGGLYVFLRGLPEAGIAASRPGWAELQAWARALEAGREEAIHVQF